VQNLTEEPMCFDRMKFECVEGWDVEDINEWSSEVIDEEALQDSPSKTVFSGSMAIMQPQDTRQYLYILSPQEDVVPKFPIIHQPGSIIPLGRLDISWRTGRLLTSVCKPPNVLFNYIINVLFRFCREGYHFYRRQCRHLQFLLISFTNTLEAINHHLGLTLQQSAHKVQRLMGIDPALPLPSKLAFPRPGDHNLQVQEHSLPNFLRPIPILSSYHDLMWKLTWSSKTSTTVIYLLRNLST